MIKLFIGAFAVLSLLGGSYYLYNANHVTYASAVADDVAALEDEFASLNTAVSAGTLTDTDAQAAYTRITDHIAAINARISASHDATLSESQRAQLTDALAALKDTLTRYRTTLTVVEAKVSSGSSSGRGSRTLTEIVHDAVATLEDHIESLEETEDDDAEATTEDTAVEISDDSETADNVSTEDEDVATDDTPATSDDLDGSTEIDTWATTTVDGTTDTDDSY